MRKIRLLAVIDHLGGGGAEYQFLELLKRLDRQKFEIRIFLAEGHGKRIDEAVNAGLDIRYLGSTVNGRRSFGAVMALRALMREFEPEVTMAWLSYSITLAAAAASTSGVRQGIVFSERSSLEGLFSMDVSLPFIKKLILKAAMRKARFVVTNSEVIAWEFVSCGYCTQAQSRVIKNGVDMGRLNHLPGKPELRRKLDLDEGTVYGVYVGKIERRKGISELVSAVSHVNRDNFELLILGSGSMEAMLSNKTKIRYLGYRNNPAEYTKAADFLVLPSHYEGLPNVILEAMALGTPVIATGISGIPEIIESGKSGLLVPAGDAVALSSAINELVSNATLRKSLAEKARITVQEFSMEKMVSGYEEILSAAAIKT